MPLLLFITLIAVFGPAQSEDKSAYLREGDRVEQQFRLYQDRLSQFYASLRGLVEVRTPESVPQLREARPVASGYGYQLLPRIVDAPALENAGSFATFSYSWPITQGYITGEETKLARAEAEMKTAIRADGVADPAAIAELIREYRELARNQQTVDQYIRYNRFWQRSIATDQARFDQLTQLYDLVKSGDSDTAQTIRDVLGKPETPSFIKIERPSSNQVVVNVPVYTDIEDETFLAKAKNAIEAMWKVNDGAITYSLAMEFRRVAVSE